MHQLQNDCLLACVYTIAPSSSRLCSKLKNVGTNIYIELKEYRKTLYSGLYKQEDKVIKNRFNFAVSQLCKIEEGFDVIKEHLHKNSA